jgi:hypothetical protein
MKKFLSFLFDKTLGKFVRLSQRALLLPSELNLHTAVHELSIRDTANYVYNSLTRARIFKTRQDIWAYSLNQPSLKFNEADLLILEFGVWKGESANYFARNLPGAKIFGFDSFEGLEEDWYGYNLPKGSFDLGGLCQLSNKM